jgi:hypothetical protein
VDNSWEYFFSIKGWFYAGLLLLNAIDLADTFMKGTDWGFRSSYLSYWVALTAAAVVGLTTTRRGLHAGLGIVMLLWSNAVTFYDQAVLGGW